MDCNTSSRVPTSPRGFLFFDQVGVLSTQDRFTEPGVVAMIESTAGVDEFKGDMEVRAKRQMPANLQVSVNLNLQFPAGINPQQLPAQVQQLLQQLQQAAVQQAQIAVQQALQAQAPLVGADAGFRNGRWVRSN